MESQSEVHVSENGNLSGLNEVREDDVFSEIEGLDDLTEGSDFSTGIQSKANGDAPALKYSELMKLGSLENASTHSLFSVVNRILDESTERKNEDIPKRAVFAMKLVTQEIEQRVSKHAENMKKLNNLFKSREDKYQSRIKALKTLATGNSEENKVITDQFQQLKIEMTKMEESKKLKDQDVIKLRKENDICQSQISSLKEELRLAKKDYEHNCFQLEAKTEETKDKLLKKILELEELLSGSANKVKELQDYSESKHLQWKRKEHGYKDFIDSQFGTVQELKSASESIKQEVSKMKNIYAEEFNYFGVKLKGLIDAAREYHSVLEENRKLYNQVQDLKGNIRVYCRIRPFLTGQKEKHTIVKDIGEDGELVVQKPSKLGKDTSRPFKFNKVFGPAATQEEVFRDTQPLIRSVLDGYNVCIFAYGQTGSGKTYTMTGPNMASPVDWGVNYRALKDLFDISQNRRSSIAYEVGVQMVEIYNEQVRDLLSNGSLPKRLGIWNSTQPNGLVVPDASMYPVKSTKDVLDLMTIGLMNRSVSATSSNERSSRSHSILTVHVRGTDLKTNVILRGCLHLVDLAGSERVDRSEAIGDRLREAQHINKSLSALGDVIFALAQKSPHVPYRNSKLTQVLQSSLGGQAKTLMFVQLNPDVDSFSETISTLKFAERVSGVELGAARSNKEGRGVKEFMEQVASLKDAVEKKDEEIGRLKSLKTNGNSERRGISSPGYGPPSPRRHFSVGPSRPGLRKSTSLKTTSDYSSKFSDKHSERSSHQSTDEDIKNQKEFFRHSRIASVDGGVWFLENGLKLDLETDEDKKNVNNDDSELLGFGDDDSEERLSDISDSGLSMGTETDGSMNSIVEYTLFPETAKPSVEITEKPNVPVKIPRPPAKQGEASSSRKYLSRNFSKPPSSKRATTSSSTIPKPSNRWL